jgi:hypothetical protein
MIPKLTPLKWFVVLTVIAVALALGLPPDPHSVQELHTTAGAYRLAIAALLIPYILIWYVSFYAFAKLQEYSLPLKGTKDGAAFRMITLGMGTLAFSLVVPTIISLVLGNIADHHRSFEAVTTIISNYLGLFPGLVAFLLLYNGARMLVRTTRGRTHRLDLRWYAPLFFLLVVIFSHLTIENMYRSHPYHLSLWLLIMTFIVPFLYAWMVGLLSAYDLNLYARTVKGTLYQRAVKQFAAGISVTILGSIAIQFVNITLAHRINKSLGLVLLIDYCLLIIVAVGLVLMALGTKKLKLIEEI